MPTNYVFCPYCRCGDLEWVAPNKPYDEGYFACNECDSTYTKTDYIQLLKQRRKISVRSILNKIRQFFGLPPVINITITKQTYESKPLYLKYTFEPPTEESICFVPEEEIKKMLLKELEIQKGEPTE
jgi:hypothetical protein